MDSIAQTKRYLPHEITTKTGSVKLYRETKDIGFVCRRYHISKASLMRWNRQYDGTRESLAPKSHKPHTPHPNAHTEEELQWIKDYHRRNPNISVCEMYGKLRQHKGYCRNIGSLYRVFVRLGYRKKVESSKEKSKHLGQYETPKELGKKWQSDVKFVPKSCYTGTDGEEFFQYTMIDEATRERFIYAYKEHSGYSSVDFTMRSIAYFGYLPDIIQTDNGSEFTNTSKTNKVHIFDKLCAQLHIEHKLIRPRTPWHNGKIERSHRSDQERFYNYLKFYSFEDLQIQLKRYLYRSNRIPMSVLDWISPIEKRRQLEAADFVNEGRATPSLR